jgi:predicted ATP-dependent endonuclease of OLD family
MLSSVVELSDAKIHLDITRSAPLDPSKAKGLTKRRDELRTAIRGTKKNSKEALEIQDQLRQVAIQLEDPSDLPTVRLQPFNGLDVETYTLQSATARAQPVAILYSTARLLSHLPTKLSATKDIYLSSAYSRALTQSEVNLNDFANWYRAVTEGAIQMPDLAPRLLEVVQEVLIALLPEMSDLQLHTDGQPQFSLLKSGKRLYLWQLSDGEQGLIALALDMVRRLAIANPFTENPIKEGIALVLIDEIELHLHPKWQRQVLRRLREIFNNCQFVVTTHSPQVIGQVRPESLRLLHQDESGKVVLIPVAQSFGMDSSWILQNIMGVPARDYETERRLSAIYQAIDDEQLQEARRLAEGLRSEIGDFPDLQEALALLDRFEILGQK